MTAASAEETTVRLGVVRSITSGVTAWASARGYFKDVGIKLDSSDLDTTANSIALLSQGQFDVIEGGISAGYFNGLEKGLPITMVMLRVTTPIGHNLMLRPDLKDEITNQTAQGQGDRHQRHRSVSTYEIGKLLAPGGLKHHRRRSQSAKFHRIRARLRQQGDLTPPKCNNTRTRTSTCT